MKSLLILRHAKSSWKDAGLDDHDRPLNDRGKREAPRMGTLIREEELIPDLILTSNAKRARKTTRKVAKAAGYEGQIEELQELYDADTPAEIVAVLSRMPDDVDRVMIVGHNPCLEDVLHTLTGKHEPMTTAALAVLEVDIDRWGDLSENVSARLVRIFRPRELKDTETKKQPREAK